MTKKTRRAIEIALADSKIAAEVLLKLESHVALSAKAIAVLKIALASDKVGAEVASAIVTRKPLSPLAKATLAVMLADTHAAKEIAAEIVETTDTGTPEEQMLDETDNTPEDDET